MSFRHQLKEFTAKVKELLKPIQERIAQESAKLAELAKKHGIEEPKFLSRMRGVLLKEDEPPEPPEPVVDKDSFFYRFPVLRGMCVYSFVYPVASLMQQYASGNEVINWMECIHFAMFGGLWLAPTMHYWYMFAEWVYPGDSMAATLKRAVLEQVIYSPFQIITFYYGMGLIQGQTTDEITKEIEDKFWPTYKVGWVYWPTIQVIDYFANRRKDSLPILAQLVPLIAPMAAFWWGYYLSSMRNEIVGPCPRTENEEDTARREKRSM